MATVDCTVGGTAGIADTNQVMRLIKNNIKFADYTFSTATDTVQALDLPAGFVMIGGWVDVEEANTDGTDIDAVLCSSGNWRTDDIDLATVGRYLLNVTNAVLVYGVSYSAADTLDLLLKTAAPTDGEVTVYGYGFFATYPS